MDFNADINYRQFKNISLNNVNHFPHNPIVSFKFLDSNITLVRPAIYFNDSKQMGNQCISWSNFRKGNLQRKR